MTGKYHHEEIYRGPALIAKLAEPLVTICGAGAVGSNLADNLARQGVARLRVIDFDRIEEHNVGTQLYGVADVGAKKVDVLRNQLFRSAELDVDAIGKRLDARNIKQLLRGSQLVVDAFDNSSSRQLVQTHCRDNSLECLHVGLSADYCEVIWDSEYRVPKDVEGDVCDYPLARNLVMLAVAIASECLVRFIADGRRLNRSMTLVDFAVREFEDSNGETARTPGIEEPTRQ